jgi:hypothetical protein
LFLEDILLCLILLPGNILFLEDILPEDYSFVVDILLLENYVPR